jgi:hypothetical protein
MKKTALVIVATVLLGFLSLSSDAQQKTDPQAGTWRLNLQKTSSTSPTYRPQKEPAVLKITSIPGGQVFVSDYVDADGQTVHTEFALLYDGKDYLRTITTAGKPVMCLISYQRIDDYTGDYTWKCTTGIGGQHTVISRDGRTRTNTSSGTTAQGQKVSTITVYDKQ